ATEERLDRLRPLSEPALPLGVMQPYLLAELLAEGVLLGEEELELEEVAETYRLVPELGGGIADAVLGRAQQGQLGDRAVHEEVDDRVAVIRRDQVLLGPDQIDGLRPAREAGDHAVLDQGVERALHALAGIQTEVAGGRQVSAPDVVE